MKNNSNKSKGHGIFVKIILWALAVFSIAVVIGISGWSVAVKPLTTEENAISEKIKVPAGSSIHSVSTNLKEKNLIRSDKALYLAARFHLFDRKQPFCMKSGVYTIKSSMSVKEIYNLLQAGAEEYISVSIPEGLTMSKIGKLLEDKGVCSKEEFVSACSDRKIIEKYNISDKAENLEGFLFPDTYFFAPYMKGSDVVNILVKNFFKRIEEIENVQTLTKEQFYQKLVLASIVEREYRVADEAVLISSVFTNRLRYNIGLYSCATVEYILTEIEGRPHPDRITYNDLKIDSPYNTYKYAGLPPGPISNPGKIAINAAVNPAKTSYYYFVLTDPATGRHTFSKNFDQHKAAENTNYVSK